MLLWINFTSAQNKHVQVTAYDGIVVGGYVNNGSFLNFTGPNINAVYKNSKFIIGMLPSLRFKEDSGVTKNAFATPNLGVGFTHSYKAFAIQMPLYYNPKTPIADGRWHLGIGLGLRISECPKSN